MIIIPVNGPALIYSDNDLVLVNLLVPEYTLKKKGKSIAFHFICEGCAAVEWHTTYIHTSFNVSEPMTKTLSGEKRWRFIRMLTPNLMWCMAFPAVESGGVE